MLESQIGLYLAIYLSGFIVAIIIHKVFFYYHPELVKENIEAERIKRKNLKKDPNYSEIMARKNSLLYSDFNDDDIFHAPVMDDSIKYFIWLSWITVIIWVLVYVLGYLNYVLEQILKIFKAITDKII